MAPVIDMTLQASLTGNAAADVALVLNAGTADTLLAYASEVAAHFEALGDAGALQFAINSFENGTTTPAARIN